MFSNPVRYTSFSMVLVVSVFVDRFWIFAISTASGWNQTASTDLCDWMFFFGPHRSFKYSLLCSPQAFHAVNNLNIFK